MFRTLVLLALIAVPALVGAWDPDLRVTFEYTWSFGETSFMQMPQSQEAVDAAFWVQTERPEGPSCYSSLVMWCNSTDPTLCVFLDDTGYIAGLNIALGVEATANNPYDWETQGFTYWTTKVNGTTTNYWTAQLYFLSCDTLATDAATRIAARDSSKLLQDDFIYVTSFNGEILEISTNTTDIANTTKSGFTEQACMPWMGRHYYYNMTTETECAADKLLTWFPLTASNQLVGIGFMVFGVHTTPEGCTVWYENPGSAAVKIIVSDGPECLYDLADSPGVITLHVYFIATPRQLICLGQ